MLMKAASRLEFARQDRVCTSGWQNEALEVKVQTEQSPPEVCI
jgi:hypothetical protein